MGRKGKWFLALKRAFTPQCNRKSLKSQKSKNISKFGKSKQSDSAEVSKTPGYDSPQLLPPPPTNEIKAIKREDEQKIHAYSVALASAVAAQVAAEVFHLTTSTATSRVPDRSREEIAAITIQTAFRGYLARREFWGLKGLVRLKMMVDGAAVSRQTVNMLHALQNMSRVQSQIRSRRVRMTEENLALQRQLQLKRERELKKLNVGEEWDDSLQTKEQIEARLLYKHEAAMRRERALAYAFSHQWKSSSRDVAPMFTERNNQEWSWSWLERWMAARPWESRSTSTGENDYASVKNASPNFAGKTTKANRDNNIPAAHRGRPSSRQSPATHTSKPPYAAGKTKSISSGGALASMEDESRSMVSLQSGCPKRYSVTRCAVPDAESIVSSPAIPGYMVSTESARFRSRFHSPLSDSAENPENRSICSVKKQLSFLEMDKKTTLTPVGVRRANY